MSKRIDGAESFQFPLCFSAHLSAVSEFPVAADRRPWEWVAAAGIGSGWPVSWSNSLEIECASIYSMPDNTLLR